MSWMKDQAAKAANISVTAEDVERARSNKPQAPRTAPGHLMQLQATADRQRQEIEQLKGLLDKGARAKRPIARMHEVPGRRRRLTAEQYAELKANLAKYPLANPVVLEERADGDWDINAGNNRVAIYRELGIEEIDSVVGDFEPAVAERIAFFSNLFAPSLSDFEKYWNFQRLQEGADALSRQELATAVGLSKTHVSKIFSFEGLPDEAKAALNERPDCLGAEAAAQLARAATEGRSDAVISAVRRLVVDGHFTQKEAISATLPSRKTDSSNDAPAALIVKVGKKSFCEITTRKGVIGIKLKSDAEHAEDWAKEIQAFIEARLRENT